MGEDAVVGTGKTWPGRGNRGIGRISGSIRGWTGGIKEGG